MKKKNLFSIILSFLKIGTIGFGGGAALIPILESEIVEKKQWLEKDKFDVAVAAATISPASLPVSICAVWNMKYSLFSAYFYALPGSVIFMTLLTGFSMIGKAGVRYIEYASAGILVFVLLLIYKFISKNYYHSVKIGIKKQHIAALCVSFLLYSGNSIRRFISVIFSFDAGNFPKPVFAVSMLDLILMLFFIACFAGVSKSRIKFGAAFSVALLYALSKGKMGILGKWSLPLMAVMLIMALVSILYDTLNKSDKAKRMTIKINYKPLLNILLFISVGFGLTVLTFLVSGDRGALEFAFKGVTSSLTSFGGGEVYYAIGYETFVETGFIPEDFYMSRILGIAGAMPGPVIVAVLAGIGFAYGSALGGAALGWVFGFLGLSMAVTATALGALSLFTVFEILKESPRLKMIIKYIIPVVCGVLLSVGLTLFLRASEVMAGTGISPFIGFTAVLIMFLLMLFVHKKYRVNDMILFLAGGLTTLAGLGILNYCIGN